MEYYLPKIKEKLKNSLRNSETHIQNMLLRLQKTLSGNLKKETRWNGNHKQKNTDRHKHMNLYQISETILQVFTSCPLYKTAEPNIYRVQYIGYCKNIKAVIYTKGKHNLTATTSYKFKPTASPHECLPVLQHEMLNLTSCLVNTLLI